ncbi:hypothetical protein SF23_02345 [Streptomyces sp. MBRL 10]|nr:hypothetical protein SF23_02345 [Streptomyces sp. MBRL 10]
MEHVWEPVLVACIVCGTTTQWSASMTLGCASDLDGARCAHCFSLPGAEWQDQLFTELGLVRDHAGYARFGDPVAAHCADPDCGAERRISITDLKRGVTPCLSCAEAADPDALHAVYKIHFPALRAYKVGITNTEVRHDRIASHVARGGILIEHHEVPNREAARTVEASVLGSVRGFPSGCTSRDFPQGGYTETWSDSGPEIDLADIVEHLTREGAPGFDRLGKLKEYFAAAPASIEELVEFRKIETEEIDGVQVHHLDLSEPLEQVLRKIRARRTAISTTAGT